MAVHRQQLWTGRFTSGIVLPSILLMLPRAGGMAIATHGLEHTGLSIDIHLSYISTAVEGDILTIEGTTTKIGQTIGFTTVNIFKGEDDNLTPVATGSHTKYILRDLRSRKS